MENKLYFLERWDFGEDTYISIFLLNEMPKNLTITQYLKREVIPMSDENFHIDKIWKENYAEYTTCDKLTKDKIYKESITCIDCSLMNEQQKLDFIDQYKNIHNGDLSYNLNYDNIRQSKNEIEEALSEFSC